MIIDMKIMKKKTLRGSSRCSISKQGTQHTWNYFISIDY